MHGKDGSTMFVCNLSSQRRRNQRVRRYARAAVLLAAVLMGPGCAAITNPVADGIPVNQLPEELRGKSREGLVQIPLTALRQKPNITHKVGPGDVLGIVLENVLGKGQQDPPVRLQDPFGAPPAMGFPILVQDDGTIVLPLVPPLKVCDPIGTPGNPNGKTLVQVTEMIRKAYTVDRDILKAGTERIIVTLLQPRKYHILVLREDGGTQGVSTGPAIGAGAIVGASRKGLGFTLDLPIGENDVLNALARTGGTPGTDAKNEVILYKKALDKGDKSDFKNAANVIRIPLRMKANAPLGFSPEDVILDNGDILYLESRDAENFFTAGLLGTGIYPLPRDLDLDVIAAVTYIKAPLLNGGFGQAQFVANAINVGIGFESPSLITVLRRLNTGRLLPIRCDLNKAISDPRERILIQPNDILVMQETPGESLGRYLSEKIQFTQTLKYLNTTVSQGIGTFGPSP